MSAVAPLTSIRPRRFLLFTLIIAAVIFFVGVPWELPPSLKDAGLSALSRANIAHFAKSKNAAGKKVDEIYGLLHLVTREDDFVLGPDVDVTQPIDLAVYADGEREIEWTKDVERLNKKYPIVVFSKVCHSHYMTPGRSPLTTSSSRIARSFLKTQHL
jgi:hypothetical protein